MTNLKNRLNKLENRSGLNGKPIFAYRMEPQHWTKIKLNKSIDVVVFRPEPTDHDRIERLTEIDQLKKSGVRLTVISEGDGWATWKDGRCLNDGGLGHE